MQLLNKKNIILGCIALTTLLIVGVTSNEPKESEIQNKLTANTFAATTIQERNVSAEEVTNTVTSGVERKSPSGESYLVTKVVDGDTLAIDMDGHSVTLRLIGIDTPETVHPSQPVECFGIEASNMAKSFLSGERVSIELDTSQGEYDKYGRLLAYVYLADGILFNELMISEGYGYEYTYNLPYKYQKDFKEAERLAQTNKKGLWADGVCTKEAVEEPLVQEASPTHQSTTQDPDSVVQHESSYVCTANIYNCSDFSTHNEAQNIFVMCGGTDNDVHRLDQDSDGEACESLP